jgi:penicillin-binding protein 1B
VKALVGGRNYGMSQLNHVLAKRQPGSIFKPFVYAAALNTGIEGGPHVLTASTQVMDEPTTFWFDGKPYEPSNFEGKFTHGNVSLREALAHSLNVPTVKVAETVGYEAVVDMANRAGMNYRIQPTPAVALGAYEITPLEAVGAYTVFSNEGEYVKPSFLALVRDQSGKAVYKNKTERSRAIDPRLAYLMTELMVEVIQHGTAEGVRARFNLDFPVAGKTGTSHDGWFAGYTSQLLCVVWVGFDDNRELDLEGAHSAAPVWANFMKRAMQFREYRDAKPFRSPGGIVSIKIDPETGMPATPNCPTTRTEVYIAGTEPVGACPRHGGRYVTNVAGWETPSPAGPQAVAPAKGGPPRVTGSGGDGATPSPQPPRPARRQPGEPAAQSAPPQPPPEPKAPEKKGFFRRLIGVFK